MGNASTIKLHFGNPASIEALASRLLAEGVDILAPGCGLSAKTPLANIQVLTRISGVLVHRELDFLPVVRK
jgi:[methyl-Co(III) methanol-specific corrinoid protein]:coenzyme M methyltransferase